MKTIIFVTRMEPRTTSSPAVHQNGMIGQENGHTFDQLFTFRQNAILPEQSVQAPSAAGNRARTSRNRKNTPDKVVAFSFPRVAN